MPGKPCFRCRDSSILFQEYSGRHLCYKHLADDILIRVKRTIRLQGGLGKKTVMVIIRDGPAFLPLLDILGKIMGKRPGMEFLIFETKNRDRQSSYDLSFLPSGLSVRRYHISSEEIIPASERSGADRIIHCKTLDEEATEILKSLLSGTCDSFIKKTGITSLTSLIPLREIPMKELLLYAEYIGIPMEKKPCPESVTSETFLSALSENHPSVPFSLIRYRDRLYELSYQK